MKHLFFAFLFFVSAGAVAQDTSGTYLPIIAHCGRCNVTSQDYALFHRKDSVVTVWGRFSAVATVINGGTSAIQFSTPIPSNLYVYPFTTYGFGIVLQSVNPAPLNCYIQPTAAGVLTLSWRPSDLNPVYINYTYWYIVH